ncbi:MAG: AAA family ATPase [Hungatella sp.]|nr:AAA family ATPase [Hungatella sp.]
MGKIEGIRIQNYGPLKDIIMGKTRSNQKVKALGNLVAIIGPSGNGKSTFADVFGFIADCLEMGVEEACDANNRGGYEKLISQNAEGPISFELYYRESSNTRPITYQLEIALDKTGRPYVKQERLRQRVERYGWPRSFLYLQEGKGYVFEGSENEETGQNDDGSIVGKPVDVELNDIRKLGIVTLGAMKQYGRVEKFLNFLRSWFLCYFSPDSARMIQSAAPQAYLNRTGSNINNVAQYMFRENPKDFKKVLEEIQDKLPGIEKVEPIRFENGQMMLKFWESGFKEAFYSQKMSDGTLKLFAYYLLLHEKNPRQLVFIEEPENGLYHQYLSTLADEMIGSVGSGFSKQIFVTTHSPFFVNALAPENVWVLTKGENGFSTVKEASEYPFVKELSEEGVEVGDMWYSKYFG